MGDMYRAQDDLSTVNADLRDTNKKYQTLLAQSAQAAAVAAPTQAQGPTTTLPPATAKPPTEKQSDFATKSLEKLPSFGESPVSIAASLRQHKALHEYIVDMPEYFKILSHARKAQGKHAEFIRNWLATDEIRKFTTFAEYEAAINGTKPQGEPPVLEALRELDTMRYNPKKSMPSVFVSGFRAALDRAEVPRDSWIAAWLFSRTLPEAFLKRAGSRLTLELRSGSFERMVVEFLAAEDALVTRTPNPTPAPSIDETLDDPMDIGAFAADTLALPHIKCRRCGGVGHVAKRDPGVGEQVPASGKDKRRGRRRKKPAKDSVAAVQDTCPASCVPLDDNVSPLSDYIASVFDVERKGTHLYLGAAVADAGGAGRPALLGNMLDCGAPISFIDRSIAESLNMTKIPVSRPFSLRGIDGRPVAGGQVTHKVRATIAIPKDGASPNLRVGKRGTYVFGRKPLAPIPVQDIPRWARAKAKARRYRGAFHCQGCVIIDMFVIESPLFATILGLDWFQATRASLCPADDRISIPGPCCGHCGNDPVKACAHDAAKIECLLGQLALVVEVPALVTTDNLVLLACPVRVAIGHRRRRQAASSPGLS
ncbi:hypothetical protein BCR44DRAFT_95900 [Catenaria anguillulae PL171]|uniref:Uncharacterized protein n=1 Tax=Catenaria anguillulae PL171 TaxID=765915 RepID=A0A1Y2HTL5_9FUNG|nr:hypothetical protein BCR44DRAFT_95900 [Catenaria anguillulae PL171]